MYRRGRLRARRSGKSTPGWTISRCELRIGLVLLDHPLDVGAHAPHLVRGPGPEVDVGEEPARSAEDENPAAHVDRLLELVRHEDRGVALHPREVDEGPPERGSMAKARASATRCRM